MVELEQDTHSLIRYGHKMARNFLKKVIMKQQL
nr:MAG TPA: hypothetical protein [Caudoviricetes sp.]